MIINQKYGKNFRMLLNERRVELACEKIDDVEHYGNKTIQSISEEVGYNSSTSFIEAFKKIKGMTPYNYQKLAIRRSMEEGKSEKWRIHQFAIKKKCFECTGSLFW